MKVVCGLGNPGAEYATTRHNVGWWVVDEARRRWQFPAFRRVGRARISEGLLHGVSVRLQKPMTFMNRSGSSLVPLLGEPGFDVGTDLLVVVDDAALEVTRVRLRAGGSAGGHNGLRSVESVLGTREYARLRIGIGPVPADEDLAEWVLEPLDAADGDRIHALLPELVAAIESWVVEGTESAANRFNR